jgi:polar amino acid transport system substrate-binding protein
MFSYFRIRKSILFAVLVLAGLGHLSALKAQEVVEKGSDLANADQVPLFANPMPLVDVRKAQLPQLVRFVVTEDFPPLSYIDGGGQLQGLHPALIKALCAELDLRCTLQVRRFDLIEPALLNKNAEAALSGLPMTGQKADMLIFSEPYYRYAGRFIVDRSQKASLADRFPLIIAVVEGSAHEAYLKQFFPQHDVVTVDTKEEGYDTLQKGLAHLYFGDSLDHAFWLENGQGKACCEMWGGILHDPRYFGQGLRIALPRDQNDLKEALNSALANLQQKGIYADLYRRFLPVDPYLDAIEPLPQALTVTP